MRLLSKLSDYILFFVDYIFKIIHLQIFLTFVSMPILLYWGLPLSWGSPLGNILFNPFIVLFLFLSSLIFFCELFYIPNSIFILALEYISNFWIWLLSWSERSWLCYCPAPSLFFALIIPLVACLLLQHKKYISSHKNSLLLLIVMTFFALCIQSAGRLQKAKLYYIEHNTKIIKLYNINEHITLIDYGCFGNRVAAPTWVKYNLCCELRKRGIKQIDNIVIIQPSSTVFKSLTELCKKYQVTTIYLPRWEGQLNNYGWQAWEHLLHIAQKYNSKIVFIDKNTCTLNYLDNNIVISPTDKLIKKNKLSYRQLSIDLPDLPEYTQKLLI